MSDVVRREEMVGISRRMTRLAETRGDHAADEFARSKAVLGTVSRHLGGRKVAWDPDKMLWRVEE